MNYHCKLPLPVGITVVVTTELAPMFLRFAFLPHLGEYTTWRGIEQMSGKVNKDEELIVAMRIALDDPFGLLNSVADKTTRIEGGYVNATYQAIDPQPERAIARDSAKWLAWNLQQLAEANLRVQ